MNANSIKFSSTVLKFEGSNVVWQSASRRGKSEHGKTLNL